VGNDTISAGAGNDYVDGQRDDDLLFGGAGQDTFVFRAFNSLANTGNDRVVDFVLGVDVLEINGVSGLAGLEMTQNGSDTIIKFDDAPGSITLTGVNMNQLVQNAQQAFVFG
jgi:Ca2+-binding RTX toxin-like protein